MAELPYKILHSVRPNMLRSIYVLDGFGQWKEESSIHTASICIVVIRMTWLASHYQINIHLGTL